MTLTSMTTTSPSSEFEDVTVSGEAEVNDAGASAVRKPISTFSPYNEYACNRFIKLQEFLKQTSYGVCFFHHLTVHDMFSIFHKRVSDDCWNGTCECSNTWTKMYDTFEDGVYREMLVWYRDHTKELRRLYTFFNDVLPFTHFVYFVWKKSDVSCKGLCHGGT